MSRHTLAPHAAASTSAPARLPRLAAVAVLWLAGLGTGFYAIVSIGARYGCAKSQHGLACRPEGTALGAALVFGVIVIVTAGTILSFDAPTWAVRLLRLLAAMVLLAACVVGAHALLNTI